MMEENKTIECPQIRYHITYDENLTLKDLEDLLKLIRMSNNDIFQEMGISRAEGNDLQRIAKIEPGSIEMVMDMIREIAEFAGDVAPMVSAIKFVRESAQSIADKIKLRLERPNRNPREDRKIYEKYEVIVEIEERPSFSDDNATIYVVHIHICNRCFMN